MERPVFNTENFQQPTPEYIKDWKDSSHELHILEWFNVDLIFWVAYFKDPLKKMDADLCNSYNHWSSRYGVKLSIDELLDKFGNYPLDDFNIMMTYLIQDENEGRKN